MPRPTHDEDRAFRRAREAAAARAEELGARTNAVLDLQRSAGNAAVAGMLARAPTEVRLDPIEVRGKVEPEQEISELEELAGAMGLPVGDPRVKQKLADIKFSAEFRAAAKRAEEQRAKEAAAAKKTEAEAKPPDPSDPHNWKQEPGEAIEAFLERQRKGLLAKELKRTGLTEAQLREQVLTKGTREETQVKIGDGVGVMISEAIPTPTGGVKTIMTTEFRKGDHIKRTKTAHDWQTGETAAVSSEVEGGKETIVAQTGDQSLFAKPKVDEAKKAAPKPKGTPHTKWTKLPNGKVKVDFIDENGDVIPGQGYVTEALQSPQDRIREQQAADPNAVWRP